MLMSVYNRGVLANPRALAGMPSAILPTPTTFGERLVHGYARAPFAVSPRSGPLFEEADLALERESLSSTPCHRQLFLLGNAVEGHSIAVDLDGTLIRYYNSPEKRDQYTLSFQLNPGAEAWLLGLSQRNKLLLYTSRDTDSLTGIFNARHPLRRVFLPHLPMDREVTPDDVYRAPTVFSLANWSDMMRNIVDSVLEEARTITGWENFVMERLAQYREAPFIYGIHALMHLKLPEMAEGQGKISFDIIVDDSKGLAELLKLSEGVRVPLRAVHLPTVLKERLLQDLNHLDDAILRAAFALFKLTREPALSSISIPEAQEITDNIIYGGHRTLPNQVQFRAKEIEAMERRLQQWRKNSSSTPISATTNLPTPPSEPVQFGKTFPITTTFNGKTCQRPIAIHPNRSGVILINYPGAGGSIDGYQSKYKKLANHIAASDMAAVVRMENLISPPGEFLSDVDYERFLVEGLKDVVDYAQAHAMKICGKKDYEIWLMGFSAGASAIAAAAEDLGAAKILLYAPSLDAGQDSLTDGLQRFTGDLSIVVGTNDHRVPVKRAQAQWDIAVAAHSRKIAVIPNADHQFRGSENGQIMAKAPFWAFGEENTFPSPEGGLILY